jgi:hypothetical protein
MYARLTVKWSNTLFGCIAALMMPIPIILFLWGPKIRSHSRFAKLIDQWREKQAEIEEERKGRETKTSTTEGGEKSTLRGDAEEPQAETRTGPTLQGQLPGLEGQRNSCEKSREEVV